MGPRRMGPYALSRVRLLAAWALTLYLASVVVYPASAAPAGDRILSLPGWSGELPSPQYSGYLDLPGGNKHLHYWFIGFEGEGGENKPVTVWLNGGPGCSSLDGLVYEHGPFRFDLTDPTKLVRFNYTWAKRSNLLYLEAPVGVGFSYSDDPSDYNCSDDTTASDNLHAIEKFYTLFPEFKTNDLFLTGESYAGVYVPTLAEAIVQAVEAGTYAGAPLKGIAVGNGCTGSDIGVCGGARTKFDAEYFAKSTAMLGPDLQAEIMKNCDWNHPRTISSACQLSVNKMGPLLDRINLYNVYGECISGDSGKGMQKARVSHHLGTVDADGTDMDDVRGPDACIDSIEASNYINQAALQKAIHVKPIAYRWKTCGSVPGWKYTSTRENLPRDTYPLLLQHMRVLIYNGDWDACVPWTDNHAWTRNMGYPTKNSWHPWTFDNLDDTGVQVGGYAVNYEVPSPHNFTFITVRGGRHEVPETAPKRAFSMFSRLIADEAF